MASIPYHAEQAFDCRADAAPDHAARRPPAARPSPELPLFRFGLRQLFWFVTGLCTLLALMSVAGGAIALGLLVAVLIVAGHVGSTVLGGRLRADADECLAGRAGGQSLVPRQPPTAEPLADADLPPSPLHERRRTLGSLPLLLAAGLIVGGVIGAGLLEVTIGHRTSPTGIVVGAFSFAVLGGWTAFLAGNFYGIARSVWHQTRTDQSNHRKTRRAVNR